MNIIVTFLSPYHKVYWKAVEHIPCLFIYLSLVSGQYFFVLVGVVCSFFCNLLSFSIYHIKGKNNNNNNKYKSKILYIKIIKVILNCNNFHNIPVLLYFWSNKCSFGKHKRHFFKTLKNVLTPNLNGVTCVYVHEHVSIQRNEWKGKKPQACTLSPAVSDLEYK